MTAATIGPEANVTPMPRRAVTKGRGKPRSRRKASPTVRVPPLEKCATGGGQIAKIPIAGGGFAVIDAEDYELVAVASWHWGGTGRLYPVSKSKIYDGRTTYMHRVIAKAQPNELVDHRNGDRTLCRKFNLRKATPGQNSANRGHTRNRHGYVGISYHPDKKARPYRAALTKDGVTRRGKYRATAEEAAQDYDSMAREAWGAFASLNFPAPGERRCKPVGAALEARQRKAPKRRKAVANA